MTYCARIRKIKAPKLSGLILVLTVLLVTSSGSACASTALGAPHTLGLASGSTQGNVYHLATNGDWDWPQVQRDPQRTGYTPEVLGTNFQVAWTHPFHPEKVFPQVQAIVYDGRVFVGTEMGNMYALDAQTGDQEWVYNVGAPILNSVATADGKVFFGAMDGAVYALDAHTGNLVWRSDLLWRHGFSTAPVFADNQVMLGSRNGAFYALDPDTGATLWQYDVGAPILQTAAYNNGRVFFGAMNMYVYALNTNNGSLAWQSAKINGMAFKDYWPVVHQGYVLVRSMGMTVGGAGRSFYALDEHTGGETITLPQFDGKTMHGATTPPAVDRDGYLVVPIPKPDAYGACWGRLDLNTQQVVDTLEGGGCGNEDENENVSCANNLIISLHREDNPGGGYNGVFDLANRTWTALSARIDWQPYENTQGGGANPVSISSGMFYHISLHYLIARTTD